MPGSDGIRGGDGIELRRVEGSARAALAADGDLVSWARQTDGAAERQSAAPTAVTDRRVRMTWLTSADGCLLLPPIPARSIGQRRTRALQPMNSGSSSSAGRPCAGRSRKPRSAPRPALTAATIAMPSRAGVMIACWTTPAVSSMRRRGRSASRSIFCACAVARSRSSTLRRRWPCARAISGRTSLLDRRRSSAAPDAPARSDRHDGADLDERHHQRREPR